MASSPRPRGPRPELEQVLEVADTLVRERVSALTGDEDIDPALVVISTPGEAELIELRGLAEIDPGWAMEQAIPALLQERNPLAVALFSDAWEPDPESPEGRREVAIIVGLDDQGTASACRGLIARTPDGTCRLGEIEPAVKAMAQGLMQPLMAGLGLGGQ